MGADTPEEGGEIEVTAEMIAAGTSALIRGMAPARLYAPMTEEVLARSVFVAMISAARCRANRTTSR